jgi:hypothetical protein
MKSVVKQRISADIRPMNILGIRRDILRLSDTKNENINPSDAQNPNKGQIFSMGQCRRKIINPRSDANATDEPDAIKPNCLRLRPRSIISTDRMSRMDNATTNELIVLGNITFSATSTPARMRYTPIIRLYENIIFQSNFISISIHHK